jgi:hypothetical protein
MGLSAPAPQRFSANSGQTCEQQLAECSGGVLDLRTKLRSKAATTGFRPETWRPPQTASIRRTCRSDRVAQCIGRKRLREHRSISQKIACVRIGSHEHHLQIWPKSCGMVRQRRAGYTRHHYIGQQDTNRGIAIEDAQSLLSRRGADAHHSVVFEGLHH